MNKKIVGILIVVIVLFVTVFSSISFNKGDKEKSTSTNTQNKTEKQNVTIPKEISIKYAFADIDNDQIIQDVDSKDDSPKADYIFIQFTTRVIKSDVKCSIFDIKNYKLDGKALPKGSSVLLNKNYKNSLLLIKLPNGALNKKNTGHTLEIAKDAKMNNITKITGSLKFALPYSPAVKTVKKEETKSNAVNSSQKSKTVKENTTSKKETVKKDAKNTTSDNKNIPKYTMEISKGIPFTTIVLVRLDTKDVENYKVSLDGVNLDIKTDSKKRKVFIGAIRKDLSPSEVKSLIKISKVK